MRVPVDGSSHRCPGPNIAGFLVWPCCGVHKDKVIVKDVVFMVKLRQYAVNVLPSLTPTTLSIHWQ
jgi:hypothetical protein